MILQAISAAVLGITAWNVLRWQKSDRTGAARGTVSVLIPARNEEHRLAACLRSLSDQEALEILVYDDHSTDATASLIDSFALANARIRRIPPEPLQPGWYGKTFACALLAARAKGDWLLFLDADVRVAPGAVQSIAAEAEHRSLTFLSYWPGFDMHGFWETVLMPMLNFVVFTIFPAPMAPARPDPSLGLAHGACILVRRETYARLGGHALVKNETFEDTLLAKAWRAQGERSLCLDGQDLVRVRMYSGFEEIWHGFGKNFYPAFRHEANFWLFLVLHTSIFLVPFLRGDLVGMGLALTIRALLAARFRQRGRHGLGELLSIVLHPLGELVLLAVALSSWWRFRTGKGVVWKDRVVRLKTAA